MKPKAKKANRRVVGVTKGSGNVFADLGLLNSERKLIRAQLTLQIYSILKDSSMTPVEIEPALIEKWNGQLPVQLKEFAHKKRGRNRLAAFAPSN